MFTLPPILLQYYITYRCNCRCRFCDIWRMPNPTDADISHIRANLLQAKRLGVRFVDFTGGEPLLHQNLPEMLSLAKRFSLRTSVTTNAILYPERAGELQGKIDFLHFSLDAASAHTHDTLRGAVCFERVIDSLEIARRLGEAPDILFTATARTISDLPELVALAQALRLILIVNPIFSPKQQDGLTEEALERIERFQKAPYVYINKALHSLRRMGGNNIHRPRCRALQSTIVISPENALMIPCFHRCQSQIPLQDNLGAIWSALRNQKPISQQGKLAHCAGCTLNCYFDPSFCYKIDFLFFQSLAAKLKYSWDKYVLREYHTRMKQKNARPVKEIVDDITEQNRQVAV